MNWRKWKKHILKRMFRRQTIRIGVVWLAIVLSYNYSSVFAMQLDEKLSEIFQDTDTIKVIHHRSYICGEEVEEMGRLTFEQTLEIMANHPEWEITTDEEHTIIRLKESILDLSDYCKENAHFGISTINDLSLFDGEPDQNKVIKTFFQLNIPYMESKLDEQELNKLKAGIKVRNVDEYESVISTFSEYSSERYDHVFRPYY